MKSFSTNRIVNNISFLILFTLLYSHSYSQISGTVFRDFNGNGTKESAEPLVAGVIVTAYNTSGSQCGTATTTSISSPNYTITGCSGNVRVEFSIPATGCMINTNFDYSGLGAQNYGSSVQFVSSTASNINFAIHDPNLYGGAPTHIPKIFNVIQRAHDPIPTPTPPYNDISYTANLPSVVSSGYFADGYNFTPSENWYVITDAQRQIDISTLALARQTGSLWGNSYSKQAGKLFVSAMLRRHCGMGPGGPGAIYMINTASPDLTGNILFANLDALGFPTHAASGAMNIKNNVARGFIAQPNYTPSTDADAYEQVGKTSLGDMDISEDGRYLFVVNLYDRKVYRIDMQNPASPVPPTAGNITSYTIPDPCDGITYAGDYRPYGLKVHRGKLYIGIVCSGQTSVDPTPPDWRNQGMRFFVYSYDLGTNNTPVSPTEIYQQSVSYRDSDEIQASGNPPSGYGSARWKPWTSTFTKSDNFPILTDIEFDNQGNMILGITDRNGYQTGGGNNDLVGNAPFTKAYANGDVLKLQNSGSCSYSPVTGSYYQNDFYEDQSRWGIPYSNGANPYTHAEIGLGGVGIHHFGDRDEVVSTALNPVLWTSNGYVAFNNQTGAQARANELWYDNCNTNSQACFWKAGALGDLEILEVESPLEIGNRVWNDTNSNGIQDAGEAGISGVTVQLYNATGTTLISSAVTDANGNYIFSSGTGTSTAAFKYGITQLVPSTNFIIRVPSSTGGLNLTTANAGSKNTIDSDAPASGDVPVLASEIPMAGANNHTFDIGYSPTVFCPDNLLVNGSFETGAPNSQTPPPGWIGGQADFNPGTFSVPDGIGFGFTIDPSQVMYQEVSSVPGDIFSMEFYSGIHINYGQTVTIQFYNGSSPLGSPVTHNITTLLDSPPNDFGGPYTLTTGIAPTGTTKVRISVNGVTGHGFDGTAKVDALCLNKSHVSCSITSAGKTNEACNNNGTPAITTDDYITFSLNPTGTSLGTGYTVSVSGGAMITPTSGTYGSATNFQMQNGSANGTTYTITVTDNATGSCQITTTVQQNTCSQCPDADCIQTQVIKN